MVFEFRVRGISKPEIQKICKKYGRLLKRKPDKTTEIVCDLLIELIYLYFDNDKEKLYKLFYPVIMANLIEKGSIHSVTEEFRETKKLYSWSYTYRTLNQLDEDVGLEISRIFRKIMFKILKKTGFKGKGFCVAIDITAKPFYGNKNLLMVKGSKRKAGTNYAIQYLTASIIEEGVRFNLLCFPISSLSSVTRKFDELVSEIKTIIPIKLLFLDRGFGNKKYAKILRLLKNKFIMPITRNHKLKELELCIKEQTVLQKDEHYIVVLDYVFSEGRSKEHHMKVKLIALRDEGGVFFFITNMYNLSMNEAYDLCQVYRYRFGIETGYRVDNIFSPFTCSVKASLRYLLMQVSLIVQDLWTFINFLSHGGDRKQPRERYKKGCSVIDVVRARIRDLGFVWRPLITAVRFKRKVEKIV